MAIKLKAIDSFYSDDTKRVDARSTFEVESEDRANHLVKRGLAERVGGHGSKKEAPPENKAEPIPENKRIAKEDEGTVGSRGTPDTESNPIDTSAVEDRAIIGGEPQPKRRGRKPKV